MEAVVNLLHSMQKKYARAASRKNMEWRNLPASAAAGVVLARMQFRGGLHSIDFLHQGILLVEAVIKPRAAKPARLTHLLLIQKLRVDRRLAVDQSGTSE